ncbi:sulfite exporter TauE/SafE family protein [Portibacter lacus]|uniref:Membrane protein n=1 Tax=Portibacter lacus TaxID=1099794 RepID=A0AA37WDP8_9BACT|nr:sulfite exporter TauE/SafE family protein [Portibacter lacus]GLR17188.1 membrane protein [Portibacter lacus]
MIYVAFTLGLFGSLHCLGMCGPLAFALLPGIEERSARNYTRIIGYNSGRVASYVVLGLFMGVLSGVINISGIQKPLTLIMGVGLILLFFLSLDIEKVLFKSSKFRSIFTSYRTFITKVVQKISSQNSFLMGMLNGFVPCGLVYLALAGAMTSDGFLKSGQFMLFFGLGTFPAMFLLLASISVLDLRKRINLKSIFAVLQLLVGCFLIYRAYGINVPENLELLWSMGKIMCH